MHTIRHPLHALLCTLFLLALSGCASLAPRDPVRIDLVGMEPVPGQGLEMRFVVKLRVQNPNDTPIRYNGIALDLDINDQPLASGVSDQAGEIPRFSETVVSVPVTISAFSALRQAWGATSSRNTRAGIPYSVRGKLGGGFWSTVRFNDSGVLNLAEPVQVY
ncbi:LEA type 2 family protein [Pseudomonas otitidis]|nr:LEA type 2 family protein [Pseudomonas otitidis]MDH0334256.1 LEA type 2 family protein [Pseudomonas otitidis]